MSQLSLADQLGWCITTKDHLNDLNSELKFVSNRYKQSIDDLKEFGYIAEKMPHLEQLCEEFEDSINELMRYINSEHLDYIHNRSQAIVSQLS